MPRRGDIQIDDSELQAALKRQERIATPDDLERATTAGAFIIRNDAVQRAPYRTGTLRRSIHIETVEKTSHRVSEHIGTNLDYAWPVEAGTEHQQAQPYLRPAFDENEQAVQTEIGDALRALLMARL